MMASKLLFFCLLLLVLGLSQAQKEECHRYASSCDECIQSGSECAWCPLSYIRCLNMKELRREACSKGYYYNPQSSTHVVRNDSSTDPVDGKTLFIQPQEVSLHLRPGVSQSFPLTISMPTDQPVTDVTMDSSNVPAGVNITFSSVTKGNPLHIQVNVEAAQCPSMSDSSNQNLTGPWSILIAPRGFSLSVNLNITLLCQCDCTGNREENHPACSGQGTLECGRCKCYAPYIGKHCQKNSDDLWSGDDSACRSGPNAPVCSSNGVCEEGFCVCAKREDPSEKYSGMYCECNNFNCPHHNDRKCGGNGKCECGQCICDSKWVGEDCSCSVETASCKATNGMLCNGKGSCQCGICRCPPPYSGPTCEECPSCHNRCDQHAACVECRAFGTGAKANICDRDCGYLTVAMADTGDDIPGENEVLCKMRTYNSCFLYTLSRLPSRGQSVVSRVKKC
ncbi:integrin beta-1-like [Leuresthes tenuis]|uniref:integrin beta-1-like n=1 Tax=Leuresthes tenuis TaxID=355514 RepID=UPI003B50F974